MRCRRSRHRRSRWPPRLGSIYSRARAVADLDEHILDVVRDSRVVRVVDELRFIGGLMVVAVQPGKEEGDRNTLLRGVVGVAATVAVVVARPGNRRVVLGVERERSLLLRVD